MNVHDFTCVIRLHMSAWCCRKRDVGTVRLLREAVSEEET